MIITAILKETETFIKEKTHLQPCPKETAAPPGLPDPKTSAEFCQHR